MNTLHPIGACLGETSHNHSVFKILKRLLLVLLQILQTPNQLLFLEFELLGLALELIDHLLLVVDFLTAFSTRIRKLLILELLDRVLALGDHLSDGLSLHCLRVMVHHVVLLFTHQVFFQLALHCLSTLHFVDVHVVTGVLDLFTALLLSFEGLVATDTPCLFTLLLLNLILHNGTAGGYSMLRLSAELTYTHETLIIALS